MKRLRQELGMEFWGHISKETTIASNNTFNKNKFWPLRVEEFLQGFCILFYCQHYIQKFL